MAKFSLLLAILFPSKGVAVDEVIEKNLGNRATGWSNQNRVALSRW